MRLVSRRVSSAALLALVLNAQLSWVNTFSLSFPRFLFGGKINNVAPAEPTTFSRPGPISMAGGDDFFSSYYLSADEARRTLEAEEKAAAANPAPVPDIRIETSEPVQPAPTEELSGDKMAQVRTVYLQWCEVYGKDVNEERFKVFSSNFLSMKAFSDETGKPLQFHKWFDCTEQEYISLTAGGTAAEINSQQDTKSEEEILGAPTSAEILDAASAATTAEEWAEVQERFSAEASARLKKIAGKCLSDILTRSGQKEY